MIPWAEVCANPLLRDLPFKIETNRFNKIVMSPAPFWHGSFQHKIGKIMDDLLTGGHVVSECAIDTMDGTKVADVAWISSERSLPHRRAISLPIALEICGEVLSPGNTRGEMQGKMQLYFERGAREVWLCNEEGEMEFFVHDSVEPVAQSRLCPNFPELIEWD